MSEAEALQVNPVEVVTPLLGLTLRESMDGRLFPTVTDALSFSLPPFESVAVAVQLMVWPGELVLGVRVRVFWLPRVADVVSLVHV